MSDEGKGEQREDADKAAQARGWRLVNFDRLKNPPTVVAAAVYVVATVFALAVLVLVAFGLFASFQIAYETATGKFADRIEAAKVFFPILLALVGGPLLIWRVITAHIQAQATRHQADTGREAHYTTLFTKAVEQLGATREVIETVEFKREPQMPIERQTITKTEPNLEVRLGAIYALDRVARDSERDHWPIMEVLCAYVRNKQNSGEPGEQPAGLVTGSPEFRDWLSQLPAARVDMQAAVTVIGRRRDDRIEYERQRGFRLDLSNANLQRVILSEANFESTIFDGAFLQVASLSNGSFRDATFNQAQLEGAHLSEGDFDNAIFLEACLDTSDVSGASLKGALLDSATFKNAGMHKVNLDGASAMDTNFTNARLENASTVEAIFYGASMNGARVFETNFQFTEGLSTEMLAASFGDETTLLPSDLARPENWPNRKLNFSERYAWFHVGKKPT